MKNSKKEEVALPKRTGHKYTRFVVCEKMQDPYYATGIIVMTQLNIKKFAIKDKKDIKELFLWFNENIPHPPFKKMLESKKWTPDAVAWFKSNQKTSIKKMQELTKILEKYYYKIQIMTSNNPGKIVYEDEYQVVAETN